MNRQEEIFFAASLDPNVSVIDLHKFENIDDALCSLEHELFVLAQHVEFCRVVYGIGKGILGREVQNILKKHPLVSAWKPEETGGSAIIIF